MTASLFINGNRHLPVTLDSAVQYMKKTLIQCYMPIYREGHWEALQQGGTPSNHREGYRRANLSEEFCDSYGALSQAVRHRVEAFPSCHVTWVTSRGQCVKFGVGWEGHNGTQSLECGLVRHFRHVDLGVAMMCLPRHELGCGKGTQLTKQA
eukprot:scaffold35478_cov28-Tisochrysis_lutea.AAC.2